MATQHLPPLATPPRHASSPLHHALNLHPSTPDTTTAVAASPSLRHASSPRFSATSSRPQRAPPLRPDATPATAADTTNHHRHPLPLPSPPAVIFATPPSYPPPLPPVLPPNSSCHSTATLPHNQPYRVPTTTPPSLTSSRLPATFAHPSTPPRTPRATFHASQSRHHRAPLYACQPANHSAATPCPDTTANQRCPRHQRYLPTLSVPLM